jgi:molybdenum cofactor guanylyltransferase
MNSPHTGFVLAGGLSSRMGANKALLELNGATLVEHTRNLLARLCERVCILGPVDLYGHLGECFPDSYSGCGPLAGIHAALQNTRTRFNLITAVDTPFLTEDFLGFMLENAEASRPPAAVTVPEVAGYVQPLCAVYTPDFLPAAEAALKAGRYKIVPLFSEVETLVLTEAQLSRFALDSGMFDNLNTPEDYEKARRRFPDSRT